MQRYRTLILLGLLVMLPLIAAVAAARFLLPGDEGGPVQAQIRSQKVAPAKAPTTRRVIVAARDLAVGTLLGDGDLAEFELEDTKLRRSHIVAKAPVTLDGFRGHAVRAPLSPGAPLTWSAVVGPGQRGFLAAALRPGTRAVTIELGKGTRHAGLIDPGDRVDVILTAKLKLADGTKTVFTRTILEDLRVVAVDRRVEIDVGRKQNDEKVKRKEIVTATLEVSPVQADRLALGQHEGTLSVAVRSLADAAERTPNKAVDLEQLLSSPAPNADGKTNNPLEAKRAGAGLEPWKKVRVFRGSRVTEHKFSDPIRSAAGGSGAK